jgi:hypothetical protein
MFEQTLNKIDEPLMGKMYADDFRGYMLGSILHFNNKNKKIQACQNF